MSWLTDVKDQASQELVLLGDTDFAVYVGCHGRSLQLCCETRIGPRLCSGLDQVRGHRGPRSIYLAPLPSACHEVGAQRLTGEVLQRTVPPTLRRDPGSNAEHFPRQEKAKSGRTWRKS